MLYALLGTAVALYGVVVGGLYLFQQQLLYRPDNRRPELHGLALLGVREAVLPTADGLSLLAWYLPPRPGHPVIAYFHGNGGHVGYRVERLLRFAREGYGVLMLEYRGYGGNPGRPSQEGLYADGRAALDFIGRQRIDADRLVLYGESLGSGVAVRLAVERDIAALVLEAPPTSVAQVAQCHYPFVPAAWLVRDRFELTVGHRPGEGAGAGHAWRARPGRAGAFRPGPLGGGAAAQGGLVCPGGGA